MDDINRQLNIVTREKHELLKVNHRWDDQYHQLEAMYKRLQQDNLRMQQEMEATIYNLKARVSELEQNNENISSLSFQGKSDYLQSHNDDLNKEVVKLRELNSQFQGEKDQLNTELTLLKHKLTEMQAADKTYQQCKEENEILRQQISAYKEDFEKERTDRERLVSEKNAMKLKHDSEMSTMHIKLDKLQRDLNYYTSNNVKLQQQLKLRSSQDSESYHSYLSTKGYSDVTTPPMDPYVERDEEDDLPHFANGDIKSCPASLDDHSRNGSRVTILNGQPRSIQNIVVARDPGNHKTSEETKSYGSRLHLPFTSGHKHKTCSRCGRKFTEKVEYQDHIIKCIQ